jgi:UDP-N-acetylmuramoyl-tripeptide--D-alanyl-D-alanine ligase
VSASYAGESFGLPLLPVPDVLGALQELARQKVAESGARIVAVTGSVGKTTTKEFTAALLQGSYRVGKTPGNANSQTGVPLTILNAQGDEEVLVLEMGMSREGEMARLVAIAPPEIALLTKIGVSHAHYFPDGVAGIAREKTQIFSHPRTRVRIAHSSTRAFLAAGKACVLYGAEGDYQLQTEGSCVVIVERREKSPAIRLPVTATHIRENFLAAVTIARSMGVEWEEVQERARALAPYRMRFEVVERQGVVFINDAYNASPESMRAALANLPAPASGGRRVAVFGEMKELGVYAESAHREIAEESLRLIDHLLCLGEGCAPMEEVFLRAGRPVNRFADRALLRESLRSLVRPGDVVLIKGSRSNGLWSLLEEMECSS